MSFSLPTRRVATPHRSHWSGAAFLVEAMLLAVFAIASIAVFTQLFVASADRAQQGERLSHAVSLASGVAERFAADPRTAPEVYAENGLVAVAQVSDDPRPGGVMHYLTVRVYPVDNGRGLAAPPDNMAAWFDDAVPVYTISTSAYASGEAANG